MNSSIVSKARYYILSAFLALTTFVATAQEKIEIDKQEVGNWFSRNWMWVVGGVVLLIIIFALSGRSSSNSTRRTKVVERDDLGNVRTTTTTETTS